MGSYLKKRSKPPLSKEINVENKGSGGSREKEGIVKRKNVVTISEIFQTLLYYNVCNSLYEIKYNLTIDQVYLMYEKCLKKELDKQKMDAITLANALVYASPASDNSSASKKQRAWNNFMNSLDWNKIIKKPSKPDPAALMSAFGSLGVPSIKKGVKN